LKDVVGLVFMEHYMLNFAAKHADLQEQKMDDIIFVKTWANVQMIAHCFCLGLVKISLPES